MSTRITPDVSLISGRRLSAQVDKSIRPTGNDGQENSIEQTRKEIEQLNKGK